MSEHSLAVFTPPTIPELVQRWVNGERIEVLAAECGVSHQTLYNRIKSWSLSSEGGQSYEQLKEAVHVQKIVRADEMLENAHNQLELARAREAGKFARWDAERRCPKTFGLKQQDQDSKIVVIVQRNTDPGMGIGQGQSESQAQVIDIQKRPDSE